MAHGPVESATVHALPTAASGGRRYRLLVLPENGGGEWTGEMEAMVIARISMHLSAR